MAIRLFSHRGFVEKNVSENSPASLQKAYEQGFKGIEFDVWFIDGELILKHNRPKKSELKTLARFSDFFRYGNEMEYWIDFKNLNEKNSELALKMIKNELRKKSVKLDKIYFAPFITNYKTAAKIFYKIRKIFGKKAKVVAVCEKLESEKNIKNLRDFLIKNEVEFLSIFHQLLDENFIKIFNNIKIFAWTVNDKKRLKELEKIGITAIATDRLSPKLTTND